MTAASTQNANPRENPRKTHQRKSGFALSLDSWAVALSLALSLLVWLGVIKHIPW
jgi:hypothetical protein